MPIWLYAIVCVIVPCVSGAVMSALFSAWDRRRRRARPEDGLPPIDYLI